MGYILLKETIEPRETLLSKIVALNNYSNVYLLIGCTLLVSYLLQLLFGFKLQVLYELQSNEVYKQVTGYLLLVYVFYQFRLAQARNTSNQIRYHYSLHKIQGVFAPLLLYVHSMEIGYAYQVLLSSVFLFNCFVGLMSPQQIQVKNISYVISWLILHVSLAVLVVGLIGYHLFVTYWYS